MGAVLNPDIVTDGLVLCLDAGLPKSYPGSGTIWNDLSGNGNNGTLVNGPTFSSGNGGSLVFDGSNDYILFPSNSINSNADLTLNFWIKSPSSTSGIYTILAAPTTTNHLQVRFDTQKIRLVRSRVVDMGFFSNFTYSINTIYNIVVTLKKSTNTWSLYINGNFVSSIVSSQTFTISAPGLASNDGIEIYTGNIYMVGYYDLILSSSQIFQNYKALKGRYD